jgi:hypothetical protein
MHKILFTIIAVFFISVSYGECFTKKVLSQYFKTNIPDKIIKHHQFNELCKILKKKSSKNYSDFGLHSGTLSIEDGGKALWIYNNTGLYSGNFVVVNNNLEIIYINLCMGCLYGVEHKDLFESGAKILMVTHGSGGTGVYTKITDLIIFNKGVPKLLGSILKEARDYNVHTMIGYNCEQFTQKEEDIIISAGIECSGDTSVITDDKGKKSLLISVTSIVKVDYKDLDKNSIDKIYALYFKKFEKKFNVKVNTPTTVKCLEIYLSKDHEYTNGSYIAEQSSSCDGYINARHAWPNIRTVNK